MIELKEGSVFVYFNVTYCNDVNGLRIYCE